MKILCVGGGPAGLYFSLLMRKARPDCEITLWERNGADDTFGFGVVFSDETLGNFGEADPESYKTITQHFAYWTDIDTYYRGEKLTATGNGFCGIPRVKLLNILQERCRELGVQLRFGGEFTKFDEFRNYDLVLAADGINSAIRAKYETQFKPTIEWGKTKFVWLGTTMPLRAFTFIFRENEHGLFQIHAYPYQSDRSTFIVECPESTWRAAGLDKTDERGTVDYLERHFADFLEGHKLLTNRSIWRSFPTIRNEKWHHENIVLIGDSAHTAHFSIGSGTKLAMEDAIALARAFRERGSRDVPVVLAEYEEARKPDTARTQKVAQTSREWFENCHRYMGQPPLQFKFNLMSRSKQITYDNLWKRDPALVERVTRAFADAVHMPPAADGTIPPPMFAPFRARGMQLSNRVVVSPMCQYSANDGVPNDWHLVHLGSRAIGGAALVFTEMTDISREGRITHGCAGMYGDEHAKAWARIVAFVHANSKAKIGMQLAHAGRKGSCTLPWEGDAPLRGKDQWQTLGPSAKPFGPGWPAPREMSRADMEMVTSQFVAAAKRCEAAGFDVIELHMAHGYLLSSFLSPKSNERKDNFGGALENRMRFPLEVFDAVRAVWPENKPIFVRLSATDWLDDEGGQTIDETVEIARALREHGCDVADVSSAGNTPESNVPYGRMYQVPFAERIRMDAKIPTMAVGAIQGADHVNTILAAGRADLCALARAHLADPYLTLGASGRYGFEDQFWPNQYLAAKPRKKR
jgi:anthraniloyl-CoA monooxygenase